MTRHQWTPAETALLRECYPHQRSQDIADLMGIDRKSILSKAWHLRLKKSKEIISEMARKAMENPDHPGRQHHFKPGEETWNKGLHYQPGGRCAETQFKPGRTCMNWAPLGSERISKDGYTERKMTDTGIARNDWVGVHRINWLASGRPLLPGHAICFIDKNPQNPAPENLEQISRAALMRRNSVHNYGPEVAKIAQLQGAITRQINKRKDKQA